MENMKNIKSCVKVALLMLFLYTLHFLLFPLLFPNYFRTSNEATVLFFVSFAFIVVFGIIKVSDKIKDWLLGDLLYALCLPIYTANDAYNVHLEFMLSIWFFIGILMYMSIFAVFELLTIGIVHLFQKLFISNK